MPARPVAKKLDMRRRGALAVSVLAVSVLAGAGLCLVGLVLAAAPRRPSRTALERRVEVHDARGDSKAALPVRRELLTLLRREGDGAAAARCLYALASDHRHLREFETAAALYREAAEAFEGQGDRDGQLDCRRMLGVIEYELDEPAKARETLLAALSWAGDRAGSCARARVLADLGNACYHLGRHDEAAGFYQQGLALEARPGHEAERAGTFNLLGRLLDQLGRLEEAERCYRSALELATRAGCALGRAGALRNLAGLEEKRGSPRRAIALCQQALSIYDELEHAAGRASALKHLGTLRAQAGDVQAAVNALQEALVGYRDLGDPAGLARCCASLGEVNERFGRREEAAACFLAAQEAIEAAAARGSRAEALAALAGSSVVRGEVEEGIRRHAAGRASALKHLGTLRAQAGDVQAAVNALQEALVGYRDL
ncbi:MAG: tetratricopeptide repeat protein, partial [Planctomycetes bacterium]|nr:tetratricopeptide repeat protein [Planctomycetota bacterium]